MRKVLFFTIGLLTVFYLLIFSSDVKAASVSVTKILGTNQGTFFSTSSGGAIGTYGGPWVMASSGNRLFLGYSKDVPENDNSRTFLSYYDTSTSLNTKLMDLPEQDIFRMKVFGSSLFVPGSDPTSQGWDAGDLFNINTSTLASTQFTYRYGSDHYVDATTTDASGNFSFTGLKRVPYRIQFVKPANYQFSTQSTDSTTVTTNSKPNSSGYYIMCSSTNALGWRFDGASFTDNTNNAGLVANTSSAGTTNNGTKDNNYYGGDMTVGGKVWIDANNDSLIDNGEAGLAGVRVEIYTRDPYFPCAVHANAFYKDSDGAWYYDYGYGKVDDANLLLTDQYSSAEADALMKSTDNGSTWQIVDSSVYGIAIPGTTSIAASRVSDYSTRYFSADITKVNGTWYRNPVLFSGYDEHDVVDASIFNSNRASFQYSYPYVISTSNDGVNWTTNIFKTNTLSGFSTDAFHNYSVYQNIGDQFSGLVPFHGGVVVPSTSSNKILRFNGNGKETISTSINVLGDMLTSRTSSFNNTFGSYTTTDDVIGVGQRYNSLESVNDQCLYAIGSDNKLYVTTDLRNWISVADFSAIDSGAHMIGLHYWPEKDYLVISTAGAGGSVYYIKNNDVVNNYITTISAIKNFSILDQADNNVDLKVDGAVNTGVTTAHIKINGFALADIGVNFSGGLIDWNTINGDSNQALGKAVITKLNEARNAESTWTLFVPIPSGHDSDSVVVCPTANTLLEVELGCDGAVIFKKDTQGIVAGTNVNVSRGLVDGTDSWIIKGTKARGGAALLNGRLVSDSYIALAPTVSPFVNSTTIKTSLVKSNTPATSSPLPSNVVEKPIEAGETSNEPIENAPAKSSSLLEKIIAWIKTFLHIQ